MIRLPKETSMYIHTYALAKPIFNILIKYPSYHINKRGSKLNDNICSST